MTLALCATLALATGNAWSDVERIATMCDNAICFRWWPKVAPPAGWQHDRDNSLHYNFNAMAPVGGTFSSAETIMYANAVFKPRVPESKTLDDFIRSDHRGFTNHAPDLEIAEAGALTTADGKRARSWWLKPKSKGQWERVAYLEEDEYFMVFVVSSRTRSGLDGAQKDYAALLGGYRQ